AALAIRSASSLASPAAEVRDPLPTGTTTSAATTAHERSGFKLRFMGELPYKDQGHEPVRKQPHHAGEEQQPHLRRECWGGRHGLSGGEAANTALSRRPAPRYGRARNTRSSGPSFSRTRGTGTYSRPLSASNRQVRASLPVATRSTTS